jgi:peptidoglycan-N-acetylmuramic acid deacetylase
MIKKLILLLIVITVISIYPVRAFANSSVFNWYCVRNKDHKQPIADSSLEFVTDYGGYYVDKAHGDDCEEKVVYLTFDAGYENGNVSKILDSLKEENVTGTFFILDLLLIKNLDLVNRMLDEGHTVANHTAKHRDVSAVSSKEEFETELSALETLFKEKTGKDMPKYFRPPEGKFSLQSMKYANELGYKTIFWSFAYADWDNGNQMSIEAAKAKIMDNIHNGAILLLHPTSETNARIMTDVIRELKAQGFRFGTMDELTQK